MEWIPITEQPLPKDGKNIMVTIQRVKTVYTSVITWICSYCDSIPEGWYYAYRLSVPFEAIAKANGEECGKFLVFKTYWNLKQERKDYVAY